MTEDMKKARPAQILLVEDNENDAVLTRESFDLSKFAVNLDWVENGRECMAYLRKQGTYAGAATPDIILLDLNMPIMDGREVLAELVKDDQLRQIPVVVLTTSTQEPDVLRMYSLRCSSFIQKPVDFDKFIDVVRRIGDYWFTLVVLPTQLPHPGPAPKA